MQGTKTTPMLDIVHSIISGARDVILVLEGIQKFPGHQRFIEAQESGKFKGRPR